jgi:hypothetical protein
MPKLLPKLVSQFRQLSPRTHKIIACGILVLALILLYPFQTTVVPLWELQVVDDTGASVSGMKVTQHWQHNSLEDVGHEDLKLTNAEGKVVFISRKIRASLITRASAPILKLVREGSGAKLGPYASVVVWGSNNKETNVAIYEVGETPPSQIVVSRINQIRTVTR